MLTRSREELKIGSRILESDKYRKALHRHTITVKGMENARGEPVE
jgi:hypothetical protein